MYKSMRCYCCYRCLTRSIEQNVFVYEFSEGAFGHGIQYRSYVRSSYTHTNTRLPLHTRTPLIGRVCECARESCTDVCSYERKIIIACASSRRNCSSKNIYIRIELKKEKAKEYQHTLCAGGRKTGKQEWMREEERDGEVKDQMSETHLHIPTCACVHTERQRESKLQYMRSSVHNDNTQTLVLLAAHFILAGWLFIHVFFLFSSPLFRSLVVRVSFVFYTVFASAVVVVALVAALFAFYRIFSLCKHTHT